VQGDILRGEALGLMGAGMYNYYSAMGNSINADTMMRVNEYIYESIKHENAERARHRSMVIARNKANFAKILERIRDNPEQYDLERGDALNALCDQLLDPKVSPSSYRSVPVTLDGGTIRRIPFFYGPRNATISMARLTTAGKWPVGLRGAEFAAERRAYERALDNALDLQIEGKLSRQAIADVAAAVEALLNRLDQVIPPSNDKVYIEAKNYLKRLETSAELLKLKDVERIVGEIDKYPGTTVHDLLVFMQRNNLRFGTPEVGDERELYPNLYAALRQQLDVLSGRGALPAGKE
jgi:hypothetical protein